MNMTMIKFEKWGKRVAPIFLRLGMAVIFLWFGWQQLTDSVNWVDFVPTWITSFSHISATTFVYLNGSFEIVFALALFLGFYTRIVSLLLGLHLYFIAFSIGLDALGMRDVGLAFAMTTVFLYGDCGLSIDTALLPNFVPDTSPKV
jgi:uncharacterized membrane protein YphA (DoxX/SURF4 family)